MPTAATRTPPPGAVTDQWARLTSRAAALGISVDDLLAIQILPEEVLALAAQGRVDLNALARAELAARGLNDRGEWVGVGESPDALLGKFAAAIG